MGATADKIEAAVKAAPNYCEQEIVILHANSMEKAVALAKEQAQKGDIVSLSPASASFDLYPNFEARGNHFKNIVNAFVRRGISMEQLKKCCFSFAVRQVHRVMSTLQHFRQKSIGAILYRCKP